MFCQRISKAVEDADQKYMKMLGQTEASEGADCEVKYSKFGIIALPNSATSRLVEGSEQCASQLKLTAIPEILSVGISPASLATNFVEWCSHIFTPVRS